MSRYGDASISDAARVIAALDLLITLDSMPAHLAGALGTPVWTLLVADADWRWMEDRRPSLVSDDAVVQANGIW